VRAVLEACLLQHSALSVGDVLHVAAALGGANAMLVDGGSSNQPLQPDSNTTTSYALRVRGRSACETLGCLTLCCC
jgi:hypothetical protein